MLLGCSVEAFDFAVLFWLIGFIFDHFNAQLLLTILPESFSVAIVNSHSLDWKWSSFNNLCQKKCTPLKLIGLIDLQFVSFS